MTTSLLFIPCVETIQETTTQEPIIITNHMDVSFILLLANDTQPHTNEELQLVLALMRMRGAGAKKKRKKSGGVVEAATDEEGGENVMYEGKESARIVVSNSCLKLIEQISKGIKPEIEIEIEIGIEIEIEIENEEEEEEEEEDVDEVSEKEEGPPKLR
jgi:hypothetical protein